ncbi:hypothetical protein ACOJBO_04360 [Rhizobium beringeri]
MAPIGWLRESIPFLTPIRMRNIRFWWRPPNQPAVLCQQPLLEEASERMTRFETFVTGALAAEANSAELVVEETFTNLPQLTVMAAKDWATRLDQLRKRNDHVATTVALFKSAVEQRREVAVTILTGEAGNVWFPKPTGISGGELDRNCVRPC